MAQTTPALFISAYNAQAKRNTTAHKIGRKALLVFFALLFATTVILPLAHTAQAEESEKPPYVGALCSPPFGVSPGKPISTDSLMPLESFKKQDSVDGVVGRNVSITSYAGEYKKDGTLFSTISGFNLGSDNLAPPYEDGSTRPSFGEKDDLRIYPNGEVRRCINAGSIAATVGSAGAYLLSFIWNVSSYIFQIALTGDFVQKLMEMIGSMVGTGGFGDAIFTDSLGLVGCALGAWFAFTALRGSASTAVSGLLYSLFTMVFFVGFLINPTLLATQLNDITIGIANEGISTVTKVADSSDGWCPSSGDLKDNYSSTSRAVSCQMWRAMVFEPVTYMQWGVSSSELNDLNGNKAPAINIGGKSVSNWSLYSMYARIRQANDEPTTYIQRWVRVVDAVASPKGEHKLFDTWSKYSGVEHTGEMISQTLMFLLACIVIAVLMISSAIKLLIYGVMSALLILLAPFAGLLALHPSVQGKSVFKKWGTMWLATYIYQIVTLIWLAIAMMCLLFSVRFLQDSDSGVIAGQLYLIVITVGLLKMRKYFQDFFSAVLPDSGAANEVGSAGDSATNAMKRGAMIGAGIAGAGAIAGGLAAKNKLGPLASKVKGGAKDAVGAAKGAVNAKKSGQSVMEGAIQGRKDSRDNRLEKQANLSRHKATARDTFDSGNKEARQKGFNVSDKQAKKFDEFNGAEDAKAQNYGVDRDRFESREAFAKAVSKNRAAYERYETMKATSGMSSLDAASTNFGLKRSDFNSDGSFASAVASRERMFNAARDGYSEKQGLKSAKQQVKLDNKSASVLASSIGAMARAATTPTYGDNPARMAMRSARIGAQTTQSLNQKAQRQAQEALDNSNTNSSPTPPAEPIKAHSPELEKAKRNLESGTDFSLGAQERAVEGIEGKANELKEKAKEKHQANKEKKRKATEKINEERKSNTYEQQRLF